jgi:hypothetical protein
MGSDHHTASDATPGTVAWTLALWSDPVAVAEYAGLGLALVADLAALERAVAMPSGAAASD